MYKLRCVCPDESADDISSRLPWVVDAFGEEKLAQRNQKDTQFEQTDTPDRVATMSEPYPRDKDTANDKIASEASINPDRTKINCARQIPTASTRPMGDDEQLLNQIDREHPTFTLSRNAYCKIKSEKK